MDRPSINNGSAFKKKFIRRLRLRKSDGLFQYVMREYGHKYPLRQQFLMLHGHRDSKHTAMISVTFQYTWAFMEAMGSIVHKYAMPLIAARTINVFA